MFTKKYILLILLIPLFSLAQNNASTTVKEKLILKKIISYIDDLSWKTDAFKIKEFVISEDDLTNLVLKFEDKPVSEDKIKLILFEGFYYFAVKELYYKAEQKLLYCFENSNYLKNFQKYNLYSALAELQAIQKNYSNSNYFLNINLELSLKDQNIYQQCISYMQLGVNYRNLKNFERAEYYLLRSEDMFILNTLPKIDEIWVKLHLASLYKQKQDFKKANKLYLTAMAKSKVYGYKELLYYIYDDYADYHIKTKNYKKALLFCDKILAANTEGLNIPSSFLRSDSFRKKGLVYELTGNKELAISNYKNSFDILKKAQNYIPSIKLAEKIISLTNSNNILYEDMLSYIVDTYELKDKAFEQYKQFAKNINEINQLENKLLLIQKKRTQRNTSIGIIIGFFVLLLLLVFILLKRFNIIKSQSKKLRDINKKIQNNNAKLSQVNEDLSQFSSIVAHDIKSSIVGLKYSLKKIKEDQEFCSEKEKSVFKKLEKDVNQLYGYIDYLMFAAKDANTTSMLPQKVDFQELLLQLENLFQEQTQTTIVFNYNEDTPLFRGYKLQMFQLLKSLTELSINNNVNKDKLEIHINIVEEANYLLLVFKDNSSAMALHKIAQLNNEIVNTGSINLSHTLDVNYLVCKKIISNYKGSIELRSSENEGNQTCIKLYQK